jgi:hypothetical protein
MNDLLLSKAFEAIEQSYKETKEESKMINICLKILLRSKKMTEAK